MAGDESDAEGQSLFLCERKTFGALCTGLTQPCQCNSTARKITKAVQVHLGKSNQIHFFYCSLGVHVHARTIERTCSSCRVSVSAL